jgi:hypothetical protein
MVRKGRRFESVSGLGRIAFVSGVWRFALLSRSRRDCSMETFGNRGGKPSAPRRLCGCSGGLVSVVARPAGPLSRPGFSRRERMKCLNQPGLDRCSIHVRFCDGLDARRRDRACPAFPVLHEIDAEDKPIAVLRRTLPSMHSFRHTGRRGHFPRARAWTRSRFSSVTGTEQSRGPCTCERSRTCVGGRCGGRG